MTRLGEGAQDTRRRVALTDLIARRDDPAQVHGVLRAFAGREARLLTLGDNAVEITHEALFAHWQALNAWIHANRAALRFRDRLRDAAKHWDEIGRKAGALWHTPDLEQLLAFRRAAGEELTALEEAFCQASLWKKRRARLLTAAVMLLLAGLAADSTLGLLWAQQAEQTALAEKNNALLAEKRARKQQQAAEQAEQRAVQQKELALKAINSLTYELVDELRKLPRTNLILTQILESNAKLLDQIYALDPQTPRALREKASNLSRTGNIWLVLGNTEKALAAYQQSLEIFERLAQADPASAEAQRDLSVSYNKIGDAQLTRGDTAAAVAAYQQSLTIRERLAQADPANASAQRDLSVSYNNIGDAQMRLGDTAAALTAYQQGLAIRERLTQADPANASAQRDLVVSYWKLGWIEENAQHSNEALRWYQQALSIAERLAAHDPANNKERSNLKWLQNAIKRVQGGQ